MKPREIKERHTYAPASGRGANRKVTKIARHTLGSEDEVVYINARGWETWCLLRSFARWAGEEVTL